MEKSIKLMSAFGDEKLIIEKLDDGSLLVEVEAPFAKSSVVLDEAGRKRLMKFLEPPQVECDTCRHLETCPSSQEPCYDCNHDYNHWEAKE
jgi:hypothetical protein